MALTQENLTITVEEYEKLNKELVNAIKELHEIATKNGKEK